MMIEQQRDAGGKCKMPAEEAVYSIATSIFAHIARIHVFEIT